MRPLLAFAAGELANAAPERIDSVAAAVELIHVYSLVHDDLPCMDDDVLRRGRPTCHIAFDEATALLVGDALQTLAFHVLAERPLASDASAQLDMVRILASAAGSRGMAGGQAIDLESTGRELSLPELEIMHIHKTGELIRAATLLGARSGNGLSAAEIERLDRFSKFAGLAFQVIDDVLDAESDTATLGKTAGKDAQRNKPTYVSLLGASRARAFAEELRGQALQVSLARFAVELPIALRVAFALISQLLRELIDFIVLRIH